MRLGLSVSCVFAVALLGIGCGESYSPLGTETSATTEDPSTESGSSTETETGAGETETETSGDGDGDGDGDPATTGDGDGDGDESDTDQNCWDAPQACLDFIDCIGVVLPGQLEAVTATYGEGGSCWCDNTEEAAQECYETCVFEHIKAIETYPTANQCHDTYCGLDELDAEQPYGKPVDGECPNWGQSAQLALDGPLGVPGSACAPKCSGIANYCPEHTQTSADGTCMLTVDNSNYCLNRCWVDHTIVGGTQCQCGATCQPQGNPDGEGNMRGICTFE